MLKGNKGERSELYVLFRLLSDGRVYAADSDLNRLKDVYFPIIKIIREEEKNNKKEYYTGETIRIYINKEKEGRYIIPFLNKKRALNGL